MLRHLFKLMWNKKKQHLLLVIEIFFSFLVIFALCCMSVYFFINYRQPIGMEDKGVWTVHYTNSEQSASRDSLALFYQLLRKSLVSMPEVKEVSYCGFNVPFILNAVSIGSFSQGNSTVHEVYAFSVDDYYAKVLGATLVEGRWFDHSDDVSSHHPVIINETLKERVFGKGPAAGQLVGGLDTKEADKQRVVGVIADIKVNGDYRPPVFSMYFREDTSDFPSDMLLKVSPDADAAFEGRLHKILSGTMRHSDISIKHLTNMRSAINRQSLTPVIIFGIIAVFLVVNVAFGLFGVLWYNISRRKAEIGLRRAVGASGASVSTQLWAETLILSTFALILGTFFAVQFPLLHVFDLPTAVYIVALIFAILFIYALVTICSLYPGRQAAGILPAVALHED